MPDDRETYDEICSGRFDRIEGLLRGLDALMRGNDDGQSPGVLERVRNLEKSVGGVQSLAWRLGERALTALIMGGAGFLLAKLVS